MDNTEREDHFYHPGGVPITPQAKTMGYEFPVYVSKSVWKTYCLWDGAGRHQTTVDKRIIELVQYCYDGMIKKLATRDDFVFYYFKIWYYSRFASVKARKKKRARLGARLFIDPANDSPWLYIFNPQQDNGYELKKGDPSNVNEEDERAY